MLACCGRQIRADVVTFSQLRARLPVLWNRRRTESELDNEIAFDVSEEADDEPPADWLPRSAPGREKGFRQRRPDPETHREVWGWGSQSG